MTGNDLQSTSFSITPDAVRIGECYTIQVDNGAHVTLDLRYTHNGGEPQTMLAVLKQAGVPAEELLGTQDAPESPLFAGSEPPGPAVWAPAPV